MCLDWNLSSVNMVVFFTEIFLSVAVGCSDALAISKNKSTCFRGGSA